MIIASESDRDISSIARAVVVRLYPAAPLRPRSRPDIPTSWLQAATDWIGATLASLPAEADTRLKGQEFQPDQTLAYLGQCRKARSAATILMAGNPQTGVRAIKGCFGKPMPSLALAAGGPATSDQVMLELWAELTNIAEGPAHDCGYCFVDFEADFSAFAAGRRNSNRGKPQEGAEEPEHLFDQFAPDAFGYQILTSAHLAKLGETKGEIRPVGSGKFVIEIGKPDDWLLDWKAPDKSKGRRPDTLPKRRNSRIQKEARRRLSPCLLRSGDAAPGAP